MRPELKIGDRVRVGADGPVLTVLGMRPNTADPARDRVKVQWRQAGVDLTGLAEARLLVRA